MLAQPSSFLHWAKFLDLDPHTNLKVALNPIQSRLTRVVLATLNLIA